MTNLEAIKKMPVFGSFHFDEPILNELDKLILDSNLCLEMRLDALRYIDVVMGAEDEVPYPNANSLLLYIQEGPYGDGLTLEQISEKFNVPYIKPRV